MLGRGWRLGTGAGGEFWQRALNLVAPSISAPPPHAPACTQCIPTNPFTHLHALISVSPPTPSRTCMHSSVYPHQPPHAPACTHQCIPTNPLKHLQCTQCTPPLTHLQCTQCLAPSPSSLLCSACTRPLAVTTVTLLALPPPPACSLTSAFWWRPRRS